MKLHLHDIPSKEQAILVAKMLCVLSVPAPKFTKVAHMEFILKHKKAYLTWLRERGIQILDCDEEARYSYS